MEGEPNTQRYMTKYSRCSSTKLFFLWQATNTMESARPKYKNLHQTHRTLRINHTQTQSTTSYNYICMIINGISSHTFPTYIKRVFSRLFRCFEDRTTLTMSFNLLIFTQRLFASNFSFQFLGFSLKSTLLPDLRARSSAYSNYNEHPVHNSWKRQSFYSNNESRVKDGPLIYHNINFILNRYYFVLWFSCPQLAPDGTIHSSIRVVTKILDIIPMVSRAFPS